MSRPKEDSLKYFPLKVGFFQNKKIRMLKSRFGKDGVTFYLYLLCEIYGGKGYYVRFDEDLLFIIADDLNIEVNLTRQIMKYLCERSMLVEIEIENEKEESKVFASVNIITARNIQEQYQESTKGLRRDVLVDKRIWVLKNEETLSHIKVSDFSINTEKTNINTGFKKLNAEKTTQIKINKIKENKKKDMPGTKCSEPVAMLPLKDGTEYEILAESFEEFVSAYPEINVLSEMRKMRAWCLSNPANRKTRRGIMKFINGWLGRAKPESQNPGSGPSYDYTGDETI